MSHYGIQQIIRSPSAVRRKENNKAVLTECGIG